MPALQNRTHQPAEAPFTSQGSQDLMKLLPISEAVSLSDLNIKYKWQFIISISLQMFLKWFKMIGLPNERYQYQIDGNRWAARIVLVPVFAHKYRKSSKIQQINASKAAKSPCWKDLCCYRASWGNQSCLCMANVRVCQVQVLIILFWRWSQCHTSTICTMSK